jgi:hypothetical protein
MTVQHKRKRTLAKSRKTVSKKTKRSSVRLSGNRSIFSKKRALYFAIIFGILGIVTLLLSRAQSIEVATYEAEAMTLPSGGSVISDSSLSLGSAVLLTASGTASTPQDKLVTLTKPANLVTIKAKGVQCSGAPQLLISITNSANGSIAFQSTVSVSNSSWADYSLTTSIPSATYSLSVGFNNDNSVRKGKKTCSRDLYIDKITFNGEEVTPPTPSGTLEFLGDAETGDASQWCGVHSAVPVLPVVSAPVRDGKYAFKSEIQDGKLIYDTERSEYANGPTLCGKDTYTEGEENYTAVSVFPTAGFPVYNFWSLVTQFKGPHTGTPPMQIALQNDTFSIVGSGRISPRPSWKIAALKRGAWNDFIIHAKWSPDASTGWFEVYYQGQLVIPKTFTSTMYLDNGVATPLFLSVGQYRSLDNSGTSTLYVDAVKVGPTLESVKPPTL